MRVSTYFNLRVKRLSMNSIIYNLSLQWNLKIKINNIHALHKEW